MGGLHKTLRKAKPKEGLHNQMSRKVDETMIDTYSSLTPKMPATTEEPVMPMADEEEIKRSKRRTASARGGGRASTIFTDSDRLGP